MNNETHGASRPLALGFKMLIVVACVEALVIIGLVIYFSGVRGIRIQTVRSPVLVKQGKKAIDPVNLAIEYKSRDDAFEAIVVKYSDWVRNHDPLNPDKSYLSSCALLGETNYVRILIKHGANVEEAVRWLEGAGLPQSAALIRQIEKESVGRQPGVQK